MSRTYRFGEFRLLPARRELWRGDVQLAVPPRAFDCIVYLVEQRDRAVGRDELIAAVWGKADISDGLLAQTILAMRRTFDDTGKEQHYVRTVVRFGYHWVAPTVAVDEEPPPIAVAPVAAAEAEPAAEVAITPSSNTGAVPLRRAPRPRWYAVAAGALALALLAGVAWWGTRATHDPAPRAAGSPATTIALVLPVEVTAAEGSDWIRLGLMDHVAARLRGAGLPVVPSDNVVVLTGAARQAGGGSAADLARAAGATLVIEARAERVDTTWRVRLHTVLGRTPATDGSGEAGDALVAARIAADDLARRLGYAPLATAAPSGDRSALDALLQQAEAATLSDRLEDARALLAQAPADQRAQPELRLRLAQIDYQAGDFDAAQATFAAVARDVSAEQDRVLHARALSNLGVIAAMRGNNVLAASRFDEAISLLRGQGAPDALGKALNGRANIAGAMDQTELALQAFAEARTAFESSGNLLALALVDSNLAALDMRRERYAEAEPVFQRAADRFATFGVHAAELNALTAVAELRVALLQADAALALEPRVRDVAAKVSDPARQRDAELTTLFVLFDNGREQDIDARLAAVLADALREDNRAAQARAHALAGRLAFERGDAARAADEAAQSLARFTAVDDQREHARVYMLRIEALLGTGQREAAAATAADLGAFATRAGSAAARLYADFAQARTTADEEAAGTWYARALGEADALRIPLDLREVVTAYAQWLIERGDPARAAALAERVAGFAARDFGSALLQVRIQQAKGDEALWRNALTRAQALAGDRRIPLALVTPPTVASR
ncbi:MAG: winged helix-turn-helix domain-containing protein [Dokdonella sp.]|uniref:winged helix-turn-helix domain-containing protein n=1 Tax=Dokdonella sp. TaxID=2291710 RepID=UPI003F803F8E